LNKFVFIIPSYNNKDWYERNLDSVFNQEYKNFRVIYIDDCSTDNTYSYVSSYINRHKCHEKITLIRNNKRVYQTYNRYIAYNLCDDDEICIMLDGDDWLLHNRVLNILDEEYNEYNLLATYGQFKLYANNVVNKSVYGILSYPEDVVKNNKYRSYPFLAYHLRTAYSYLFKSVPIEKLKDENDEWLKRKSDEAEMLWVLEHSEGRNKNIGQPIYVYNQMNSIRYEDSWFLNKRKEKKLCLS